MLVSDYPTLSTYIVSKDLLKSFIKKKLIPKGYLCETKTVNLSRGILHGKGCVPVEHENLDGEAEILIKKLEFLNQVHGSYHTLCMKGLVENSTPAIFYVTSYKFAKYDDNNYKCNIAIGGSHYEHTYVFFRHAPIQFSMDPWVVLDDPEIKKVYNSLSSCGNDNVKLAAKMVIEDEATPIVYKEDTIGKGGKITRR